MPRKPRGPNKSNWEVKDLIDHSGNIEEVVAGLFGLATGEKPNIKAIELLMAYRFGKPKEFIMHDITPESVREVIGQFSEALVSTPASGVGELSVDGVP